MWHFAHKTLREFNAFRTYAARNPDDDENGAKSRQYVSSGDKSVAAQIFSALFPQSTKTKPYLKNFQNG